MFSERILSILKALFTISLCIAFGYFYGQIINKLPGMSTFTPRWTYAVLAIPVFLPIFEYIRTSYKQRSKFSTLVKEIVFSFISALIVVLILSNLEIENDYSDYILAILGLGLVLISVLSLNYLTNRLLDNKGKTANFRKKA